MDVPRKAPEKDGKVDVILVWVGDDLDVSLYWIFLGSPVGNIVFGHGLCMSSSDGT